MGNRVTLLSACAYRDLGTVRKLLKTCTAAELEARDDSGRTPLLVAVRSMTGKHDDDEDDDLIMFGLDDDDGNENDDDDDDDDGETEQSACNGGDGDGGAHRAQSGIDLDEHSGGENMEPIAKEAEILHLLLRQKVNVDHQDENGWTALHHACFLQNPVATRMLIQAGARPVRDSYGLLPQDFLVRGHLPEWSAEAQELKDLLDHITTTSPYSIKLLAFRPSGIVQLDMGAQVEKGALVTIEYDVPENHSPKDYIQVLISAENSADVQIGSYHHVPPESHGQITISTQAVSSSSTIRFVYVKTDINKIARNVVASGCNAVVQASVGEIFQYELYLYERVVEVESIPEFEFIDQPLIVLKRIGIIRGDDAEIEWVEIRPDNHIVAVNDIRIDSMDFSEAVHVLQENNGKKCTKLLMQNYSACGDFIPEKILGMGVVGKFAFLSPQHDDSGTHTPVAQHSLREWVGADASSVQTHSESASLNAPAPASRASRAVDVVTPSTRPTTVVTADVLQHDSLPVAIDSKLMLVDDSDDDPASGDHEDKVSASSTIETVVPLHNSRLVDQMRIGISESVK